MEIQILVYDDKNEFYEKRSMSSFSQAKYEILIMQRDYESAISEERDAIENMKLQTANG